MEQKILSYHFPGDCFEVFLNNLIGFIFLAFLLFFLFLFVFYEIKFISVKNDFLKYLFSINDFITLYNIGEINKNNFIEKRGVSWIQILNSLDEGYNKSHDEKYYDYKKKYIERIKKSSILTILFLVLFCFSIFFWRGAHG
jgi:hypothetical protein